MKRFATLKEAKTYFKKKTGYDYDNAISLTCGTKIFRRKKKVKLRYLVGTYMEWLNL
jgi:hypothetical protein